MKKTALIFGALALGAATTAPIIPTTPDSIQGRPLYDTPSGELDIGYFIETKDGPVGHLPETQTATTTRPEGFYPVAEGMPAHIVGLRYTFYDKKGKILGDSDDQTITQKLRTKDEPLPTINTSLIAL